MRHRPLISLEKLTYNERRIIDLLRSRGAASRAELARDLNVSAPTLTRLTANLIEKGILEAAPGKAQGRSVGQPSKALRINAEHLYTAGIYFDPDSIHCCLANLMGKMLAQRRYDVGDRSFAAIMRDIGTITREIRAEAGIGNDRLIGYGLSYPGQYTVDPNYAVRIQQFRSWPEINIGRDLAPYFDGPVHRFNDAKAICLAELFYGACRTYRNIAFVWLSYGIGGAVVLERQLYMGQSRNAAEFGGLFPHSQPRPSGQDLLDTLNVAGLNLSRLSDIGEQHRNLPVTIEWKERAAEQLRWLCLVISRMLDVEAIVIGGTLPPWLLGGLVERLQAAETLGEDFHLNKPDIRLSQFSATPQLGASAIPIYHAMHPTGYDGPVIKGW
ncbi:MAG: ROK family protein [Proteobacteria bacterium]|nr:ROK family protein [Pseudomonadota bacterium]